MNENEIRKEFLAKATPLLDQYVDAALGRKALSSINQDCRIAVWRTLRDEILKSDNYAPQGLTSKQDVMDAVLSGEMTIEAGYRLLNMFDKLGE